MKIPLPKKTKTVLKKALPFATSEKRERISNWWSGVCDKVSEHKQEKCRHQMHKDLQHQLKSMRRKRDAMEDALPQEKINHSPASASVANISQVDLNLPADAPKRKKKITSIGRALSKVFMGPRERRYQELVEKERKREEAKQRLENQKKNLDDFIQTNNNNNKDQEEETDQQKKATSSKQNGGYEPELAPLLEEDEEDPESSNSNQDNTSYVSSIRSIPERPNAPLTNHLSSPQTFYRFPFDKKKKTNSRDTNEDNNSQTSSNPEQQPDQRSYTHLNSPFEDLERSIISSFRLSTGSQQQEDTSLFIRTYTHDPITERRTSVSNNMGEYLEDYHDSYIIPLPAPDPIPISPRPLPRIAALFLTPHSTTTPVFYSPEPRQVHYRTSSPITYHERKIAQIDRSHGNLGRQQSAARRRISSMNQRRNISTRSHIYRQERFDHQRWYDHVASNRRLAICDRLDEFVGSRFYPEESFLHTYFFVGRNRGGGVIGEGINGQVKVVARKIGSSYHTGPQYAIKTITLNHYQYHPDRLSRTILQEVLIMNENRRHKNLMSFVKVFYFRDTVTILMERMTCDLFTLLEANNETMPEDIIIRIISKMVKGLVYLQKEIGYFHGDIKPDNVLITASGEIKMTDFGLSAPCGVIREGWYGTEDYMAPEVSNEWGFNEQSDIWSLGVTLLILLNRGLPRLSKGDFMTSDHVLTLYSFDYLERERDTVNSYIINLFKLCLRVNARERCTMTQIDRYFEQQEKILLKATRCQFKAYVQKHLQLY